jgi:hypothetical protein
MLRNIRGMGRWMPYVASAALIVVFAVVVGLMAVRSGGGATEASSSAPSPIVPRISVSPRDGDGDQPDNTTHSD